MNNRPTASVQTALSATQVIAKLAQLEGWKLFGDGADLAIEKTFHFPGYLQTVAFANAVAFIAESSKHYPELLLQSQQCSVRWNTRDVQGISAADFACAAQIDALLNTN